MGYNVPLMTQQEALDILKTGANVFLTGEPGSGKTHVLNEYVAWLEACSIPVAVTASTGIAATHIGGMTIHSWSGIGARGRLNSYDLEHVTGREKIIKRVQKTKVLVIDEISMLDGRLLDTVEVICRRIYRNDQAFGGMQIVVVGDFFQLPPIAERGDTAYFAFESHSWKRAQFLTCYLNEQYRHEDELLLGLLNSIRRNDVTDEHYTLLSEQKDVGYEDVEPTRLFTHNKSVDEENQKKLSELKTESREYKMETRGSKQLVETLVRNCLSPERLVLKREAMVMCTKNNFEVGYVNGTLGRVVNFDAEDGYPIITTSDGRTIKIMPSSWSMEEDGKVLAEITQVPLRLAWAITVHKSQGMSLDAAEIDLRGAFAYGQGYVALSRVRSLFGMKVLGLNANALMVDPKIVTRDQFFKAESEEAERVFGEMDEDDMLTMQKNFVKAVGGSWNDGSGGVKRTKAERIKSESTYERTKEYLRKGLSAKEIAKERNMALSTIWSHIEKLALESALDKKEIASLIPAGDSWEQTYQQLKKAFDELGIEKLKPIFEVLGGQYDYDTIRLGRILYSQK